MRVVVVVVVWAAVSGCASAPMFRPVSPPMDDRVFEAGAGVHGVVGQDVGGVGTGAWLQGQVAPDVFLVARGHFTDLFPYRGGGGLFKDTQFGGAAGFRGVYRLSDDLHVGGEALLDYQQISSSENGTTQYFVSGIVGLPVAEMALPDVWVYVEPSLGAGYRFGDVSEPFSGFLECPIGVAWRPAPWALLVVEGGFAIPFEGGYLGLAGAFRL
ncbi:MAG: hypothetical protein Q8O67_09220 [Deltaproteobacteria bacterium]|nr:hypothetical protein [Deltaproteobacteria bacterium]